MSAGVLAEGSRFADRYEVVRCLASGGMGSVYEVIHLETERRRALKIMHTHFLSNDEMRSRFRLEARVASTIESDHIVDVFDAGIDQATGMPFLVMELLRGEDLGSRLRRTERLEPTEAVEYLRQTALALDKTHRANIVHRDLKPDNLFLCERDEGPLRIKVLDFGIAKLVAETAEGGHTTRSLGTPVFMAPEQFNADPVSPRTDIYALGMIAYMLIVGVAYWHEEATRKGNVYVLAGQVIQGLPEPASVRALRAGVTLSPAFDAWFSVCTALHPEDRFASAVLAINELSEALGVSAGKKGSTLVGLTPTPTPGLHLTPPQLGMMTTAPLSAARSTQIDEEPRFSAVVPRKRAWLLAIGLSVVVASLTYAGIFVSRAHPTSKAASPAVSTPERATQPIVDIVPAKPDASLGPVVIAPSASSFSSSAPSSTASIVPKSFVPKSAAAPPPSISPPAGSAKPIYVRD